MHLNRFMWRPFIRQHSGPCVCVCVLHVHCDRCIHCCVYSLFFFFFCKLFSELSYIYFCFSVHSGFFSLAFVCVFDCIEMIRICWRETPIMSPHVHMPLLTLLHRSIFIHQNYFLWLDFVCLSYKMSPLDLLFRWRIIIVIIIILNNLCSCFDLWLTNLDRTGHSQWIYIALRIWTDLSWLFCLPLLLKAPTAQFSHNK